MPWFQYVGWFFGGAFFANALPHVVAGVSGQSFYTPFASPPFKGLSSPAVNVAWALANLALAYVLLVHVGTIDVRSWADADVAFAGFALMALQVTRSLGRLRAQS